MERYALSSSGVSAHCYIEGRLIDKRVLQIAAHRYCDRYCAKAEEGRGAKTSSKAKTIECFRETRAAINELPVRPWRHKMNRAALPWLWASIFGRSSRKNLWRLRPELPWIEMP